LLVIIVFREPMLEGRDRDIGLNHVWCFPFCGKCTLPLRTSMWTLYYQ